jgi:hypothetical protein
MVRVIGISLPKRMACVSMETANMQTEIWEHVAVFVNVDSGIVLFSTVLPDAETRRECWVMPIGENIYPY